VDSSDAQLDAHRRSGTQPHQHGVAHLELSERFRRQLS
jgi:hypothetical protein